MRRLLLFILIKLAISSGWAQSSYYSLPAGYVSQTDGALLLAHGGVRLSYIDGFGWVDKGPQSLPLILGSEVYVTDEILSALGLDLPRLRALRSGGDSSLRLVLDFEGVTAGQLSTLSSEGRIEEGQILRLRLPELLLPLEPPDPVQGIDINFETLAAGVMLELSGPSFFYRSFSLSEPTRLVLDLTPLSYADITPETRSLRPGVIYKRFSARTGIGSSGVHVLEIAPNAGEFRVVGSKAGGAPLSDLASGAFAAINAGYFDTQTFQSIGLLEIDHGLLGIPFLNRASIGFGAGRPVIDRVQAALNVRISGRFYELNALPWRDKLTLSTQSGRLIGSPSQGVITVAEGRILENKVGPRRVPENGFALAYEPDVRPLALADSGDLASYEVDFAPDHFNTVRYAVEAGPLLLKDFRPAFQPEQEAFRRNARILDQYTQQAAIGIKADGSVLFLIADNMIAEELVGLFQSLGAKDAMRLDSGSSSTLFVDGRVLNRKRERRVVSGIVFLPSN